MSSHADQVPEVVRLTSPGTLRVVDLGTGMAAALTAKLLADAGATVERLAPEGDEVFDTIYPAHSAWRAGSVPVGPAGLEERLASADVCVVGGEDHPDVATRRDARQLADRHPQLVVVDLTAYDEGYAPGEPAVDILVQARSGLSFEHWADAPLHFAVPFPTYSQALLAALGTWAALLERLDGGAGQVVTASLQQSTALFLAPLWLAADQPDEEFDKVTPKDVRHLIFPCADGTFVQFVMGVPAAVQKLYRILDIDREADPEDRGIPKAGAPAATFFGDLELIGAHTVRKNRDEIIRAAQAVGLPAAPVLEAGEFWVDEQISANGILTSRDGVTHVGNPIGCRARTPITAGGHRARTGPGVLDGLLVLDFGTFVAGPFTSRLLADLGATVIKVEGLAGDPNRGIQRHYLTCHLGKQSLVLDLKSPRGARVLDRLLARADVVTHNFRVGVAERLGLDPESVRRHNPAAITLHTIAYGPQGPRAKEPGFDMVIQALLGLERRAGGPGSDPLWYRTPYLDYGSGALGAIAVLMALHERRTRNHACDMWVSLLNTGMFLTSDLIGTADGSWLGPAPLDAAQLGTHPAERLYRTADGWIAVAARNDDQAAALWRVLLGGDSAAPRHSWDDAVSRRLQAACARRRTRGLLDALQPAGVWAAPCTTDGLAQIRDSPAAYAAGWADGRLDERFGRLYGAVGPFVDLQRGSAPADTLRGAPARGAHTRQILRFLDYAETEIDELYDAGAVE